MSNELYLTDLGALMTRLFLLAAAPFLLTGCLPTMVGAAMFSDLNDRGNDTYDYAYDDDTDYSYEAASSARWIGDQDGEMSGRLPTVGEMRNAPASVDLFADDYALDFDLYHYGRDGFGMIGGYVELEQPLAPGQVIPLNASDLIGCSGPETGVFDFDDAPVDAVLIVDEGTFGDLLITIDVDFGNGDSIIGVAEATDEG